MWSAVKSAQSARGFGIRMARFSTVGSFLDWVGSLVMPFRACRTDIRVISIARSCSKICSAVTGACLLVRKKVFDETGGFDETNLAISFNDVDFCLRLQAAGFQNVWTPYANLIHHESASRGHQRAREEQMQFVREATFMQRKWGIDLLSDPFYNPNLTLNLPGFELAVPPRLPEFADKDGSP